MNEPVTLSSSDEFVLTSTEVTVREASNGSEMIGDQTISSPAPTVSSSDAVTSESSIGVFIDSKIYRLAKKVAIVICTVILAVLISVYSVINSYNN